MIDATRIYSLDIETDTTINGLDPRVAAITEVAVVGEGFSEVFSGDEKTLLLDLEDFLRRLQPGLISTWNGGPFDMPFLSERYKKLKLDTFLRTVTDPTVVVKYEPIPGHAAGSRAMWGPHKHVDISPLYADVAKEKDVKHSLKPVYSAVTGKTPMVVDRANMHLIDDGTRRAYAASDGIITRELTLEIPYDVLAEHIDQI